MQFYDNGEIITKERIEKEEWYSDYQSLMEISMVLRTLEELYAAFLKDYLAIFGKDYPNRERILRWAVLHVERIQIKEV